MNEYVIYFKTYLGYKSTFVVFCDSESEAIRIFEKEYPLSDIERVDCY